jgi:hypothetical protein
LTKRLAFPLLCGGPLIVAAVIPEIFGWGSPGFGLVQLVLLGAGCTVIALTAAWGLTASRAAAFLRARHRELLLAAAATAISLAVFDLVLGVFLPPVYQATQLGWDCPVDTAREHYVEDTPGRFRTVTVSYTPESFRRWPARRQGRLTGLVIGDSFTEMNWVNDGEEWFAVLERDLSPVDWYVFGCGGYGSLQEYLMLDRHIDDIRPDFVVWQFCRNDYENNLYDLDRTTYPYNNHAVRPYLEGGDIVYRLPLPLASLRNLSFSADRLLAIYDRRVWKQAIRNLDDYLVRKARREAQSSSAEQREAVALQTRATQTTARIMAMVRQRVGDAPIFLFNACGPLTERELEICRQDGLKCVEGVSEYVDAGGTDGLPVKIVNNGHWNRRGNQLAGEYLQRRLRQGLSPRVAEPLSRSVGTQHPVVTNPADKGTVLD